MQIESSKSTRAIAVTRLSRPARFCPIDHASMRPIVAGGWRHGLMHELMRKQLN